MIACFFCASSRTSITHTHTHTCDTQLRSLFTRILFFSLPLLGGSRSLSKRSHSAAGHRSKQLFAPDGTCQTDRCVCVRACVCERECVSSINYPLFSRHHQRRFRCCRWGHRLCVRYVVMVAMCGERAQHVFNFPTDLPTQHFPAMPVNHPVQFVSSASSHCVYRETNGRLAGTVMLLWDGHREGFKGGTGFPTTINLIVSMRSAAYVPPSVSGGGAFDCECTRRQNAGVSRARAFQQSSKQYI